MTENTSLPSPLFAHLLRRFRRAAGLTQEELAERANLSARAVSDLERDDDRVPRRDTLELLADALQFSTEDRAILDQTVRRARAASPPSRQAASTPSEPDANTPDGLPTQPTAFIGREHAVEAVRARLLDPETRLLTLTGPGGVGKTRLSLQAAAAARPAFADGVAFVPLAPISDPDLVLSTIARTLDVGEAPGQAIGDTLAASLRGKRMLLVLDNFEQVLLAGTPLMALLASAPDVKALVTSRSLLHVRGERVYPVSPLTVPTPPLPPLEALSQYEAVRLFIARAQDAQPDFVVTNETAPAVAEICARLDGLPLAIELAATRTRLLSPDALLARLSNRLKVVTGGSHDLPERQQTLRAAIDWSYSLLDPGEQALFARLAVFVGGRTLEAVEAVCDADGGLPFDALDGVESLLDKSLLRREVGANGEPRLVMLETIHEYARERLFANGEATRCERTHALYYLALVEKAAPHLDGSEQEVWFARLEEEHDNIRAALRWARDTGENAVGLRIVAATGQFWEFRGYWAEGRRQAEVILAANPARDTSDDHVRARAEVLRAAGFLALRQTAWGAAEAFMEEGLSLFRELHDEFGESKLLSNLAVLAHYRGDYARAQSLQEDSLIIERKLGRIQRVAMCLNNLGIIVLEQGDIDHSAPLLDEAVTLFQSLGDSLSVAGVNINRGLLALYRGDYAQASALLRGSLDGGRQLGNTFIVALARQSLGELTLRQEAYGDALGELRQAMILFGELGETKERVTTLELIAHALQGMGRLQPAARVYGAAEAARETFDAPIDPMRRVTRDQGIAAVQVSLDAMTYDSAWTAGRELSLEQAIAEALAAIAPS